MVHLTSNNTTSRIVSKGISSDKSINSYRGLVSVAPQAKNARNYTVCDSMLIVRPKQILTLQLKLKIEQQLLSTELQLQKSVQKSFLF